MTMTLEEYLAVEKEVRKFIRRMNLYGLLYLYNLEDLVHEAVCAVMASRKKSGERVSTEKMTLRIRGSIIDFVRKAGPLPRRAYEIRTGRVKVKRRETETRAKTFAVYRLDDGGNWQDRIGRDGLERKVIDRIEVERILKLAREVLSEREYLSFFGYFFEEKKLNELGKEMGISESRVSQLVKEAVEKIRKAVGVTD